MELLPKRLPRLKGLLNGPRGGLTYRNSGGTRRAAAVWAACRSVSVWCMTSRRREAIAGWTTATCRWTRASCRPSNWSRHPRRHRRSLSATFCCCCCCCWRTHCRCRRRTISPTISNRYYRNCRSSYSSTTPSCPRPCRCGAAAGSASPVAGTWPVGSWTTPADNANKARLTTRCLRGNLRCAPVTDVFRTIGLDNVCLGRPECRRAVCQCTGVRVVVFHVCVG